MTKTDGESTKRKALSDTIQRIYGSGVAVPAANPDMADGAGNPSEELNTILTSYRTWILAGIVLLGAILRVWAIGAKTIWLDEAFSIWVAHHPLPELFAWLVRIDQHPPLYYVLLHYWQALWGDGQGAVRLLSAVCGTAAIPFFYGAARRFCGWRAGLIAAFLLAVAPFHVRFGQETRMYALLTLHVALALYFLARILCDERRASLQIEPRKSLIWLKEASAPGSWIGFILAQAAVMLTHNTAAVYFPLALNVAILSLLLARTVGRHAEWEGEFTSLPALNRPLFLRSWMLAQSASLILWLPWARPFALQVVGVDREFWIGPPTAGIVLETFHNFNLAHLPDWFPLFYAWDFLYWGLAVAGIAVLRRKPARLVLLLSLFLVPVVTALLVSVRRPIFYDRTLIWVTLPYYLLIGAGLDSIGRMAQRWLGAVRAPSQGRGQSMAWAVPSTLAALLILLSSISLYNYYAYFEKEEWADAADFVAQQVRGDEMILFNATWVQLPFEYYLRHYDLNARLKGMPVDLFDRGVLEPRMTPADLPYLHELTGDEPRIWLVYSHDWYTDPERLIPQELQRTMRQTERREFTGLIVMRFDAR